MAARQTPLEVVAKLSQNRTSVVVISVRNIILITVKNRFLTQPKVPHARYPFEQQENAGSAATSPNCPPPLGFPFGSYHWRGSQYSLEEGVRVTFFPQGNFSAFKRTTGADLSTDSFAAGWYSVGSSSHRPGDPPRSGRYAHSLFSCYIDF